MSATSTPPTVGTPARLQLAFAIATAGSSPEPAYPTITPAAQRQVRSQLAQLVRAWFPLEVRDEWLALVIPTLPGGTYPTADALALMSFKLQDPRISRANTGIDPNAVELVYNIHDDVQCSSVKADLITTTTSQQLVANVEVEDPSLPGGSAVFAASFQLELKWEIALGDVVL